jgi:hypothetical protein
LAVTLKRFLEPEWVFIFGIGSAPSKAEPWTAPGLDDTSCLL